MHLDRLYDTSERCQVEFVGYATDQARYDFAFVYTENFFGKPIVICMQTGKSALLCIDDASHLDYLQRAFKLAGKEEAEALSQFLQQHLPFVPTREQY